MSVECYQQLLGVQWWGEGCILQACRTPRYLGWSLFFPPLSSPQLIVRFTSDHRGSLCLTGALIHNSLVDQSRPKRKKSTLCFQNCSPHSDLCCSAIRRHTVSVTISASYSKQEQLMYRWKNNVNSTFDMY